jgi:two-component system cell cycle response regulator
MGSFIQKIFQGRGDKKGKGFRIKRVVPLFSLVLVWLGLVFHFPLREPLLWFSLSAITSLLYILDHFVAKRKEVSVEFLFSLLIVLAGTIQYLGLVWLRMAYFPAMVAMAAFYGLDTIIPLVFLLPVLEVNIFLSKGNLREEAGFLFFAGLTGAASSFLFQKIRKEKESAVSSLTELRDNARNITLEAGMESLSSDEVMTHYFASVLKTDEEIRDLLLTAKHSVFADAASLFMSHNDSYVLRCSSEDDESFIATGRGVVPQTIRDKKTISYGDLNEKDIDPGYLKNSKVTSLVVAPVLGGSAAIGALAVDSSRYQAFSETEKETIRKFALNLARVLERERIYMQIKREIFGITVLKEESSDLVSSLNVDVLTRKLCEAAAKIVRSDVFFFISDGKKFRLLHSPESYAEGKKLYDFKGTVVNMALENKQLFYASDMTDYRIPGMPFRTGDVRSMMIFPLLYENDLLGILVMLSDKKNFLYPVQTDMLKVMCNQAVTSLANARLHGEIQQMATTDGLTGLFNHRLFQEKLSEELKRLNRFSEPVSLLLADIDYFKKVNDSYGHPVGDSVLRGVAEIIRETVREVDIPARYGGEEFAVILPGADTDGAKIIAERLRKTVMGRSFSSDDAVFKVTLSIGISTSPADAGDKEGVIEKADQALYHAKHNGRNQSASWSSVK